MILTVLFLLCIIIVVFNIDVVNIIQSYNYQFKHWYYVNKIYIKNYGIPTKNVLLHDFDKLWPILIGVDRDVIKENHTAKQRHHLLHPNITEEDIKEAVCDWESARFTKPDKQKTAFEYFSENRDKLNLRKEEILLLQYYCLKVKSQ